MQWADVAKDEVTPHGVVEAVDVARDGIVGFGAGRRVPAVEPLSSLRT